MTPIHEPQSGASARPWHNDRGEIFDHAGNEIAYVHWVGGASDHPCDVEGRANAALIVQAINAFDPLVAALTALADICDLSFAPSDAALSMGSVGSVEGRQLRGAVNAAREALRLAAPAPAREGGR